MADHRPHSGMSIAELMRLLIEAREASELSETKMRAIEALLEEKLANLPRPEDPEPPPRPRAS